MSSFAPGERALVIGKSCESAPELRRYIGQTVTVVREFPGIAGQWYEVRAEDGFSFAARYHALQKLPPQPPREETTRWERCVWQPSQIEELA